MVVKNVYVALRIAAGGLEYIDRTASELGCSRSQRIRDLLTMAVIWETSQTARGVKPLSGEAARRWAEKRAVRAERT